MDQLSWEKFFETSSKLTSIPNKVEDFNRLIAHTKNFFVISGYGAFTPGYLIIITKKFIPSFAIIDKDQITELKTLIDFLKKFIEDNYNRKSILFEHGMCACVGGLDRNYQKNFKSIYK
jgi:galactose-1-phosphate uridylyltransferase